MGLSEAAISELRSIVEQTIATSGASNAYQVPGTAVVVVDKEGDELFAQAAGKRGVVTPAKRRQFGRARALQLYIER